ncbi:MAG TPA: hypothetical protein VF677_06385 [Flavobacterium sp.]
MRKIYFLLLCFFTFGVLSAQEKLSKEEQARREKNIQAGNPFAKFGYKAKVATLSKGKYLEVHDLDSIVTIGSVRYHVDKNQIVGTIVIDATDMYARPIGDTPSRWLSPDPLSEEFTSWSPYTMCFDNPMKFVDPTGMAPTDWFRDLKGVMQFDPKVQSQADLGNKGTYVGDTAKETTKNGGTANYREDGSILYSNEKDAYSRIWNNTRDAGREQVGVIGDKGVLVLPDYKNSGASGSIGKEFGYSFKNGNLQDPLTGKSFNTIGTVHAHLSGSEPSTYTGDGWGDLGVASMVTPNKPVFVMQNEKGVNGLSVIFSSPYTKGTPINYRVWDVTKLFPNINSDNIQRNTSLRNFAKSIDWKANLK